jgi:hypothetical protein
MAFREHFHTGAAEPLVCKAARSLTFDRHFWNLLVSELLLYSAAEIPEIQVAPETLCWLLAPEMYERTPVPRACFASIQQVHFGTRELRFGTRCYRAEQAGYNDTEDVARLSLYLSAQSPEQWTVADLAGLREITDGQEREEELEFTREWFPALVELYQRAAARRQIIVCEIL